MKPDDGAQEPPVEGCRCDACELARIELAIYHAERGRRRDRRAVKDFDVFTIELPSRFSRDRA